MASNGDQSEAARRQKRGGFLILLIVLGGAVSVLCRQAFLPYQVHWSNDNPLGGMIDACARLPGIFFGNWENLGWLGRLSVSASPTFSTILQMIFPPEIFMKIYVPLTMIFLGVGAWLFFRQLGFARPVSVVGGLGAGLNMHFFSNAAWGLGPWCFAAAMVFVTLAVIVSPSIRPLWVKSALTGLCAGMVVMEGFDTGAILTLYIGLFIVFYFLTQGPNPVKETPKTIAVGSVVVFFALLFSMSTLYTLVGTSIKGIANSGETAVEKEQHWDFTTQWSFPKLETIRLFIPGVFGYRLQDYVTDTNKASSYWGKIAEDVHVYELESGSPATRAHAIASFGASPDVQSVMEGNDMAARDRIVDQIKSQTQRRHTGSGDYTGLLVCLLAVFGLLNSWRKSDSPYSKNEVKAVWFWGIATLISLLAAWGRFGPLYQFIYHIPFISNIRNPIKFLHPLNVCLIILSGYGLEALHRRYLSGPVNRAGNLLEQVMRWWRKAAGFDKNWVVGTLLFLGASLIGLLLLTSSKNDLVHYLQNNGFPDDQMPQQASQMASFCIHEVVMFIVFFAVAAGVIIVIFSGAWNGSRSTWAWVFLGAIMILDLLRADAPWVRYYDYKQKYSMNPVVAFLKHDPWEHRVMSRFLPTGGYIPGGGNLGGLCHWWLENDYLANNIQSLEIDQAPRLPDLDRNYIGAFTPRSQQDLASPVRLWRLTNTKYILADARITPALNQLAEPKNSFTNIMLMDIVLKPWVTTQPEDAGDLTVQTNDNGAVALIEFTQALPRAKLFSNWQVADDNTTLSKLNSSEFDPAKTVFVASDTPPPQKPAQPDADPGTVTITSYLPKDITLQADAKTPAVLLFNDRIGDDWHVWVDQKPSNLLRCNYIMRGVFVPPGQHTIEFRFQPTLQWLYITLVGFAIGVLLVGYVIFTRCSGSFGGEGASSK